MIRKLLVVAAAIAMPVSVVAVSGGLAGASNSHGSPATATAACGGLTGTLSFSPKLTKKGGTAAVKTTVKATVTKCTNTGGVTITSGAVSGTLTGAAGTTSKPTETCTGLSGPGTETGTLTIKWTPSSIPSTTINVKSDIGGIAGTHGSFTLPGKVASSGSGSFSGTNHGASDKSLAETTETLTQILTACGTSAGVPSLAIQAESGKTAVSLG